MRLHLGTGHARVRINGSEHWLGRFGSPEAQAAYDRLIAEYLSNGRQVAPKPKAEPPQPSPSASQPEQGPGPVGVAPELSVVPITNELTVAELCVMFMEHAKTYYRLSDGRLSSSYHVMLQAVNALRPFGKYPAADWMQPRSGWATSTPVSPRCMPNSPGRRRRSWHSSGAQGVPVLLVQAAQNVVPVAVTAGDKIESLRQWASDRCLSADRAEVYSRTEGGSCDRVRSVVREPGAN